MNKPKKPTLPTMPRKSAKEPDKRVIIEEYIPGDLDLIDNKMSMAQLIREINTVVGARDPEKVMLLLDRENGYYGECTISQYITETKEVDNRNYANQLDAFHKATVTYNAKLENYDVLLKQYHIDIEQYDYDMKTYYDWIVAQKKGKK